MLFSKLGSAIVGMLVGGVFLALLPGAVAAIQFPPTEADWQNNRATREDPRPLNIPNLATQPTIDGVISPGEWSGARLFSVIDPITSAALGTILAGRAGGFLNVATDWTVNTNPDAAFGGGNAWRFGTSNAQGPQNSGNGTWFEIFVRENGGNDDVMVREAVDEVSLQNAVFQDGALSGIDAGSNFNGSNWQYEIFLGSGSGPGPLPSSFHWEWRQLDPAPGDGQWIPVFDGSVHVPVPEPATPLLLLGSGLAAMAAVAKGMSSARARRGQRG